MSSAHATSKYRDFQQCTINWCYSQLYGKDHNGTKRFLVADEVGLGKTLIAQGLIGKLLVRNAARSIVYVCSSLDIINQNRTRLNPAAGASSYRPTRITLIRAWGASRRRTRFYFLTPGTSLFIKNSTGIVEERLYMAWLAKAMFGLSTERVVELFECNAPSFGAKFREVKNYGFKPLGRRERAGLEREWQSLVEGIKKGQRTTFRATVTSMRLKLARIMLGSLDPDLIILDEFQKFKSILMASDVDQKNLCPTLLRRRIPTLMLSATPYRLPTGGGRTSVTDNVNHYDEFKKTLEFLTCDSKRADNLLNRVWEYGSKVRTLADDTWRSSLGPLLKEKHLLEADLTQFISRTERVFFQHEELNPVETKFLSAHAATGPITKDEIKEYLLLARRGSRREILGYWKSGSHLMSYLQEYVLGKELRKDPAIANNLFLYTALKGGDSRSRKIEYLAKDVFQHPESPLHLWIPPLAPYYPGRGIFSPDSLKHAGIKKGLVFSAWKFVPRFVAAELSRKRDALFHRRFTKYQMKVTPVTWASFFYPSVELAGLLTHEDFSGAMSYEGLKSLIVDKLRTRLASCRVRIHSGSQSAKPWELLRHLEYAGHPDRWKRLIQSYKKRVSRSRQRDEHKTTTLMEPRYLGYLSKPFTEDLLVNPQVVEQLAEIAISSPAVAILRGMMTVAGPGAARSLDEIGQLCMIELRSFIGRSTTVQCVRNAYKRGPYSQRVAQYFRDGNIQAVLDEYLFCIAGEVDRQRITKQEMTEILDKVRSVFQHKKSVLKPYKGKKSRHRVNTHVAMAFGESQDEGVSRDDLRIAFNSPFWPFILATTSVGQEGLDFHLYCKDIYHWNLPANPVDFEQREGRLNRYNSLSVRDAVTSFGFPNRELADSTSRWQRAFDDAYEYCHYNDRYNLGLSPNWICTPLDGKSRSRFVRHILDLPQSSDRDRYHRLMDRLRLYRLALGQPNPDRYLHDLEKNGFLRSIDTRSLYLNLFPFHSIDQNALLLHVLARRNGLSLLFADATRKASKLVEGPESAALKKTVNSAIAIAMKRINGDYKSAIHKPVTRRLVGAILQFVEIHDAINDRVPLLGYRDDIRRLEKALPARH